MELISTGYRTAYADRWDSHAALRAVGAQLPRGAKVLVHETHLRLGVGAPAVSDARGTQGALSYSLASSPQAIWQQLTDFGVTHVVWPGTPMGLERWGDDIVFHDFVARAVANPQAVSGYWVGALGPPSPAGRYGPVAVIGCAGFHRVPPAELDNALGAAGQPIDERTLGERITGATFIMAEDRCTPTALAALVAPLPTLYRRAGWTVWVHR
jgi:hypothetical protein